MNEYTLLWDGNNLVHRLFYRHGGKLLVDNGNDAGLVNAVFNEMRRVGHLLDTDKHVFTWDSYSWRKKHFPEYKAHRKKDPVKAKIIKNINKQIDIIRTTLKAIGLLTFRIEEFEADDLMASLIYRFTNPVIISTDQDYLQLLDDCNVFDPMKGNLWDRNKFAMHYGFEARRYIDVKCLAGDKSDNVPGVPGWGDTGAKKLIQEYESLDNVWEEMHPKTKKQKILFTDEAREIIYRNHFLMALRTWTSLDTVLDNEIADHENLSYSDDLLKKVLLRYGLLGYCEEPALTLKSIVIK